MKLYKRITACFILSICKILIFHSYSNSYTRITSSFSSGRLRGRVLKSSVPSCQRQLEPNLLVFMVVFNGQPGNQCYCCILCLYTALYFSVLVPQARLNKNKMITHIR